ncbi:MAG: exopolysaccharide biosynthesis protein [Bauldia sp.]|nr:exopolysaccharide biosynthesis protein [Bauldia sp.]
MTAAPHEHVTDLGTGKPWPRIRSRRPSTILRILAMREEPVSLGDLATAFGDGAFALIMLVFGLVTVAAVPPGTSIITGAPIVVVAWQLMLGRQVLWLPETFARRQIPPGIFNALRNKVLPRLRRVERLLRPRAPNFFGPRGRRLVGAICLFLGCLIVAPIPFGNFIPGIAVAVMALALFRRDGLAALAGIGLGIVAVAVVTIIYGGLIYAAISWLSGNDPPPPPPGEEPPAVMDGPVPGPDGPPPGGPPRP